ncbi:MAG: xylulokinase [Defluviitaleaceae bacterium]|nr:xylulokinase [Defluviitaleaceae bacterium]MCL2263525.1 xylulokinase [Defluviitaleaceae bacterium]
MLTVGIDIGTSAVKLVAVDEKGAVLRTVSRDYPLYMYDDGRSEQAPQDWWEQTSDGLRELTEGLGEIAAVSFSGQMHGLVMLDENDNVLRRAILWNDQRTQKQCDYLNNEIGREVLLENAANIALTGFTAPKILWVKDNEPEIFAKVKKIMLPKDYIAYKLSGVFATDYSDASGMLLLDVKKQDWSDKMLEIVGVTRGQLPKLFHSYEAVGNVTAQAVTETGLSANTKVVIGGGDQAVGAVGSGIVSEGMCSVSLGTSGVLFVAADNFAVDTSPAAIHAFCHSTGRYHFMGVTLAAAGSNKWWNEEILSTTDYPAEQKNIDKIGTNPVYFLPYLSGERTPHNDSKARGAFVGMSMTTTRADMTQAVLEGVSFSLRDILTRVRGLGANVTTARIIGGGAKSPLWCQMIADILRLKVEKMQSEEGPAFGAAILAMVGADAYKNVEDACAALIKITETFTPNETTASNYDKRYPVYVGLYGALKDSFHTIAGL